MPSFQGQTDQVVKIQVKSYLLFARWLEPEVAANGEAVLEVITVYVGDGAKIEATIKDLQGKTLTTLKGLMHSNVFRARYKVPPGNTTGGMTFEANLPAHHLKLASQPIKVGPPVEFSELKWLDPKEEKTPADAEENQLIRYQAKVKGLTDGDEVHVRVSLHVQAHKKNSPVVFDLASKVEAGQVKGIINLKLSDRVRSIKTSAELKKEGHSYYAPTLVFSASAKGISSESPEIPLVSKATLYFQEAPGIAGKLENKKVTITTPDGKRVEKTIPKDGVILLEKTKPGKHVVASDGIQKLNYSATKPPVGSKGPKDLTDEDKLALVKLITLSEGGKGEAAYWAMNLDYEFEGRWDLPKGWYKKSKGGAVTAKPDKSDPNVPYSKYSDHPRHVGLSFGTIQFTQEGPLGEVVKAMQEKDSGKFKEIFGEHADELVTTLTKTGDFLLADEDVFDNAGASMGKKKVKRRPSVQPVGGHDLWKPYWTERFKKAGAHPAFQECQDQKAVTQYLDPCLKALSDAKHLQVSQKCLALLYDRSVNNGVGRARKLVAGLAKATDEKEYWKGVIAEAKATVKSRMQHLYDSTGASWDTLYTVPEKPKSKSKPAPKTNPTPPPQQDATTASSPEPQSATPVGLKKGATGPRVQELNIRLTGFGPGEPSAFFETKTENRVKAFQKEYLGMASPSGVFDSETAKALDEFADTYLISPEASTGGNQVSCSCGSCSGFGEGRFKGEYSGTPHIEARHRYEYPGLHRALLWAVAAMRFRATKHLEYALNFDCIFSGYRCWHDNEAHNRQTTNHMGKAVDLHFKLAPGKTMKQTCDLARNFFVDQAGAQIGWAGINRLSLEPNSIAPTWVHMDVRQYQGTYLEDGFFTKTLAGLKGQSAENLVHD